MINSPLRKSGARVLKARCLPRSLIVQGDRILALNVNGTLLYLKAHAVAFELIDKLPFSEVDTRAHLAVSGNECFTPELNGLIAYRWGE